MPIELTLRADTPDELDRLFAHLRGTTAPRRPIVALPEENILAPHAPAVAQQIIDHVTINKTGSVGKTTASTEAIVTALAPAAEPEVERPKRTRRTQAQIAADKAAEEAAKAEQEAAATEEPEQTISEPAAAEAPAKVETPVPAPDTKASEPAEGEMSLPDFMAVLGKLRDFTPGPNMSEILTKYGIPHTPEDAAQIPRRFVVPILKMYNIEKISSAPAGERRRLAAMFEEILAG